MSSIGDNIKAKRIALGMSADDLAKRLGKSRATVYRYESSDADNMPISILEPLAKALNTTPAELMGWSVDGATEVKTTLSFTPDNQLHSLTQAYLRRPKLVQEEIIRRLWALDTTFSRNVSELLAESGDYNGFMASTKINQKTFAHLLTGAPTELTPDEAENIANFFGVNVVDLFFSPEKPSKSSPLKSKENKEIDVKTIINEYRNRKFVLPEKTADKIWQALHIPNCFKNNAPKWEHIVRHPNFINIMSQTYNLLMPDYDDIVNEPRNIYARFIEDVAHSFYVYTPTWLDYLDDTEKAAQKLAESIAYHYKYYWSLKETR